MSSSVGAIIVSLRDLKMLESQGHAVGRSWLITANPYTMFAHVAQHFVALTARSVVPGIHPSASMEEGAKVPTSCSISSSVTIEVDATLDERVRIANNSFVGVGVRIDDDTLLHTNFSIYHGCEVGTRCILYSDIAIGTNGFGFVLDFGPRGGEWVKIPQADRAVIGDDAEIGANTAIGRGTIADMVVEQGYRINNQVQITHNVYVGVCTVIAGYAAISGNTKIGHYCIIGGVTSFADHLTITDRVTASGGISITKSVTKLGGHFVSVFLLMSHGDWERNTAIVRGLARIRERLQQLEQRVKDLQQQS